MLKMKFSAKPKLFVPRVSPLLTLVWRTFPLKKYWLTRPLKRWSQNAFFLCLKEPSKPFWWVIIANWDLWCFQETLSRLDSTNRFLNVWFQWAFGLFVFKCNTECIPSLVFSPQIPSMKAPFKTAWRYLTAPCWTISNGLRRKNPFSSLTSRARKRCLQAEPVISTE